MRPRSSTALASALVLLSFAAANDTRAGAIGFTSQIAIELVDFELPPIPGSGTLTVNGSNAPGHLTSLQIPASAFETTALIEPYTDPAAFPINGFHITAHNGAGNFGGSGGAGFGGVMPLAGTAKVCLFGLCGTGNNVSNLTIPLTVVGQGGYTTVMGAINLTVIGAPWTTGTVTIMHGGGGTSTRMGGVSPLSATDVVTLVTPIFISTNIQSFPIYPTFATLTLTDLFVPEPGTLALLVAGVAGLGGYGRLRMRRAALRR